jgi:23S rRNA (cytidine1920-2'-O)/16S rRNA (cytidine1409-2'-O)-methyltransferase
MVGSDASVALTGPPTRFVSRGGEKLDGALDRLRLDVRGCRWLDAGASTGGFTDCLLQRGASQVVAVDVGYGQLDWRLRNDDRVVVIERVNVRDLTTSILPWRPEGVVADLSFISLRLILPAVVAVATDDADIVAMVKPQFEVGRAEVGKGGVVRDPALWASSVERVVDDAAELGLGLAGVAPSVLPGPAGNREFFVWLRRDASMPRGPSIAAVIEEVAAEERGRMGS